MPKPTFCKIFPFTGTEQFERVVNSWLYRASTVHEAEIISASYTHESVERTVSALILYRASGEID